MLYRVVGPGSADNSTSWMSKNEFDRLRSKPEWRDRFAVWNHWNANGEFLTYTVPPGAGIPVWRGKTASQELKDRAGKPIRADDNGSTFWLDGGAEQIVVDPKMVDPEFASARQYTGWGYDDGDVEVNLVGVPILTRNWKE